MHLSYLALPLAAPQVVVWFVGYGDGSLAAVVVVAAGRCAVCHEGAPPKRSDDH